jgi:DNA polymerase-3 subunit gamma/tau
MFENILHQECCDQLKREIKEKKLPQSILLYGPEGSGKGTAALELARVLSCENEQNRGDWKCQCSACLAHKALLSPDLALMGKKPFYQEIAACNGAFEQDSGSAGAKQLFIRSARKLLLRFSPVLVEDNPKLQKTVQTLGGTISSLNEDLDEFEESATGEDTAKTRESILKNAAKLEAEGITRLIPIDTIRRAAYWSRLAPAGLRKCVIIENADRMEDEAKNSLLKILEEPPERLTIILTCVRPGTLLPTIVSRLRQYRFAERTGEQQREVIQKIFRNRIYSGEASVGAYLESFLPLDNEVLYPLAALYAAAIAARAIGLQKAAGRQMGEVLADLGKFALARSGQKERPPYNDVIGKIFKQADNFTLPGLFSRFCTCAFTLLGEWLREGRMYPQKAAAADIWKNALNEAILSAETYNIQSALVFDTLGKNLSEALSGLG